MKHQNIQRLVITVSHKSRNLPGNILTKTCSWTLYMHHDMNDANSTQALFYQFTVLSTTIKRVNMTIYHRTLNPHFRHDTIQLSHHACRGISDDHKFVIFAIECSLTLMNVYGRNSMNVCEPRDECVLQKFNECVLHAWWICTLPIRWMRSNTSPPFFWVCYLLMWVHWFVHDNGVVCWITSG